jgi:tetratricopeptide (TPR) repeat protein
VIDQTRDFRVTRPVRSKSDQSFAAFVLALLVSLTIPPANAFAQDEGDGTAESTDPAPMADPVDDPAAQARRNFKFSTIDEMVLPETAHFLSGDTAAARDWIVLVDGQCLEVLPVTPRPGTLAQRRADLATKLAEREKLTGGALENWRREYAELMGLAVTVPALEPEPEYRIPVDKIDRIVHHEDQWLLRIGQVIQDRNVETALELINALEQWRPDWPGIEGRVTELIFADGDNRLQAGQREEALMLFEEVSRRTSDFPGLGEKAGAAVDQQIAAAIEESDYRQARYFLDRLNGIATNSPVWQQHSQDLAARATALVETAKQQQAAGDLITAVDMIEQAARIWPEATGLAAAHKSIVERYQRLRGAVLRLADEPTAYPFPTDADLRHQRLTEIPLFEVAAFREGTAEYRTRFFDEWMPNDLGRTMRFTLRQTRQPWETQPVLLGWPITSRIAERLDPQSSLYDQRLAGYVRTLTIESPFDFTIDFRRVPPRLEALFGEPIVVAPRVSVQAGDADAEEVSTAADGVDAVIAEEGPPAGGFQLIERNTGTARYRRYLAEPEKLRRYHVAEIVEVLQTDPEAALHALEQGDVDMYANPPLWIVRRLQGDMESQKRWFILKHALPETHVLQFNPESAVLKSRELRRALIYASDRQGILEDVFLREPEGSQGRVVAGPFPSNSRANSVEVQPRPYDPYAALALTLAAKNSLTASKVIMGEIPTLRLLVPPDALAREAAEKLIAGWGRIGITVELIPDTELNAYANGQWDLIYRQVQMTEPVVQLWPFLAMQETARIEDLDILPDWLKQGVIELDRTSDWSRAEDQIKTLHRHLSLEAALIPLWEVDQYSIFRKNVQGLAVSPVHCYDNIDEWIRESGLETGM